MEQWLEDLLALVDANLIDQQLDPADVHWSTRRRMAYEIRWPASRQMEAHFDASQGSTAKLEAMQAEFASIKATVPKEA